MAELDMLLLSFVLPWLGSIPISSADWGLQCLLGYLSCSKGYLYIRDRLGCPEAVGQSSAVLQGLQHDDAALQALQQWLKQPPSQELLVEVLPVVVRLCLAVLHQLQRSAQSEGVEEQSSTAHSKGGAAASRLGGSELANQRCTALLRWVTLLQDLLTGCSVVIQQSAPASSIDSSHGKRFVLASQDVFRQQAAGLFTVLEGSVRYVALSTPYDEAAAEAAVANMACLYQGELGGRPAALQSLACEAGPGSQTQQLLCSLLCSLVKLSLSIVEKPFYAFLRCAVAEAALMLLVAPTTDAMAAYGVASAANAAMLGGRGSVVQTAAVEEAIGSAVAAAANATAAGAAKDVLPSLVILGRCCLQWAQELEAEVPFLVQQSAESLKEYIQQPLNLSASAMCCRKVGRMSPMEYYVRLAQHWLQAGSHAAELSAAGYATETVLQQLEQLLAAVRATKVTGSSSSNSGSGEKETPDAAAYAAVTKQLQSAGMALCALAVPCMCNYPGCTNMSGLTELGTVSGRSCMCGGCRVAHYCSRAHQKQHWKQHKPVCAALAAARVAVAPAAAPV